MMRTGPILVAAALTWVTACGGGGGGGGGGGDDDGAGGEPDAAPPAADAGEADSGALPDGPGLAGILKDGDGEILANQQVLACMSTVCLYGMSAADGSFSFPIEPPVAVALKTPEDLSVEPRRGSALCPVSIASSDLVVVGDLHCPLLPAGVPFGPATADPQVLAPGDGLELTLRRADLTPRVGDTLVDAAARRVPPEQVCSQLAIPGEEIAAVYALHPFGALSSSPIAVRVPSDLPAGTPVSFRTIDEIDGTLSDPVPGTADGQFAATDADAGIAELSWLVLSR
jgi:hypothetical protein